jgi:hypothetical protein
VSDEAWTPVSVTVDSVFEVLNAALLAAVALHGNKSKAFAWDVNGYFLKEWGHYRTNAPATTREGEARG